MMFAVTSSSPTVEAPCGDKVSHPLDRPLAILQRSSVNRRWTSRRDAGCGRRTDFAHGAHGSVSNWGRRGGSPRYLHSQRRYGRGVLSGWTSNARHRMPRHDARRPEPDAGRVRETGVAGVRGV